MKFVGWASLMFGWEQGAWSRERGAGFGVGVGLVGLVVVLVCLLGWLPLPFGEGRGTWSREAGSLERELEAWRVD